MKINNILILIFVFYVIQSCDYKEIQKNKGFTIAIIKEKLDAAKLGYSMTYEYKINNQLYEGMSQKIFYCDFETTFKGKYFPIVYSTKNPEKSIILISPRDFKRWGYEFPDSLMWVKNCFHGLIYQE